MIDKTILHYKISRKLGEGGMGIVYQAEDSRLKRDVAIKFLPGHVAGNSEERERFKIEAQAAAALNHPNITHIYAIEETDEQIFIVMEYINGEELKKLIKNQPDKFLPLPEFLTYAVQIAQGLQAAHKNHIVHRDIKSANIMLTSDGLIKVMDFGLAKVRGGSQVTKAGTTLGTAAYMSPEQARGEDVDHRSDLWSFGVVMYEMLSGSIPFHGDYEAAVTYAIIHDEPVSLKRHRPDLPAALISVIDKCLEKEPSRRMNSASEILDALQNFKSTDQVSAHAQDLVRGVNTIPGVKDKDKMQTGTIASSVKNWKKTIYAAALVIFAASIVSFFIFKESSLTDARGEPPVKKKLVVLPFINLGSSDQDYFSEGITGEITSRLSGLANLGVIARSSAMHYKDSEKSLDQIGRELGVDYVLEGTIQWENHSDGSRRVRINPELIKIDDATQIWSDPYEVDFSSAFQIQSDIARQVASALDIKLRNSEDKILTEHFTENPDAFDYYLKGMRYASTGYDERDFRVAEEMFEKAVELDPAFVAAFAQLANVQIDIYWFHYEHSAEQVERARRNLERAMAINPNLSIVHTAKGWFEYHALLNYENALKEFDRALELQPNNTDAYQGIAAVLRRQGKFEPAAEHFIKALEIDPRSSSANDQTAETYMLLRRFKEALGYIEKAISLNPDVIGAYRVKSDLYLAWVGDTQKAREVLSEAWDKKIGNNDPYLIQNMVRIELMERNLQAALTQIRRFAVYDDQFYYLPQSMQIALTEYVLGKKEKAQPYFRQAQTLLEEKLRSAPDEPRFNSALGLAYAGLGETEKAIQAGKRGLEIMPVSREAWRGAIRILDLATVYTMVGEYDSALDQIELLLAMPSNLTVALLEKEPVWDPLRGNPRFAEILTRYK